MINKKDIEDATRFSNFAQKVKMKFWQKVDGRKYNAADEEIIDEILLIAYDILPLSILESLEKDVEGMTKHIGFAGFKEAPMINEFRKKSLQDVLSLIKQYKGNLK